jgi:signal transduction histidine kinase
VGLLVIGGSYLIGRAVSRELQVARLQADFVSAVSHEFRTPLTAIRQLSELLTSDRAPTDDMRREYSAAINRESSRLHRLVEGLLRFGRMEAGAIDFQWASIDATALVEAVVTDFRHEAARHGHEIAMTTTGPAVTVQADREALGTALWNLLDNAVKYSPECRTIWVETCGNSSGVRIQVRDRGIGIDPDDRSRIFGTFVRGRDAAALGVQGTGIGLAVTQRIVRRHGGTLEVESRRGEGSTFTIALPAASQNLERREGAEASGRMGVGTHSHWEK